MKILLDCDPGHDDAIAILLCCYSEKIDLLAVTTSSGNQTIEKTTRNARNMLNFCHKGNIPFAKGNSTPLIRPVQICAEVHGESGLDGYEFPSYAINTLPYPASELIIRTVKANPGLTIVTTGPMTNLAIALKANPSIIPLIKEIVLMGGSTREGNITKAAEFNILVDPEAADICFKSGIPLRMLGLNVTRKILVNNYVMEEAKKINTRGSDLFVKLMEVFNKNQREFFGLPAGPLHDPATIISLINPNVFKFEKMNVRIDTSFSELAGKTYCSQSEPYNCLVATEVNLEEYWDEIYKHLRRCV